MNKFLFGLLAAGTVAAVGYVAAKALRDKNELDFDDFDDDDDEYYDYDSEDIDFDIAEDAAAETEETPAEDAAEETPAEEAEDSIDVD